MNRCPTELTERQYALAALAQLREAGLTHEAVRHRIESGALDHAGRGVYRIAGAPQSWHQSMLAALLAAGPSAVASHRAAAVLLGFPGFEPGAPELTTPRP